jgi:hypothetical protein
MSSGTGMVLYMSAWFQGAWAPTAMSQRGQCLGPTLPEARDGWYLSVLRSPRVCGGPDPLLR